MTPAVRFTFYVDIKDDALMPSRVKFLQRAKRAYKQRRRRPMIEDPKVGDEVILHGCSEEGERGQIVQLRADYDDGGYEEGIRVKIIGSFGFVTHQWCSPWELERVDIVTRLGEVADATD